MNNHAGRIDVVTIFPKFFDALDVSLIGKARQSGNLEVGIHDLREWATDRHRSVDDTPAGGGAGMVMRADIWGAALDDVLADDPILLIPTPAGAPLTQRSVEELSRKIANGQQLVIACGRYEGIDARVVEHYRLKLPVQEVSIGDYVLNGGEAAALVIIEAVSRLLPGVIGNPESLVEESHGSAGLLEYPVYTQPVTWRNLDIPEVLRSGDHRMLASWRREHAVDRTARVRPDLMRRHGVKIRRGKPSDSARLHEVASQTFILACPSDFPQSAAAAFVSENLSENQFRIWARKRDVQLWVAEVADVIVGYTVVLLRQTSPEIPNENRKTTADLSKMYTLPEHHGADVAAKLLKVSLSSAAQAGMETIWLGVNQKNTRAQRFYEKHGFKVEAERTFDVGGSVQGDFVMKRTLDFPERQ